MDEFVQLENAEQLKIYQQFLKNSGIYDTFAGCQYSRDGQFPLITHNVHGYYHNSGWSVSKFRGVKTLLQFTEFENQYLKTKSMENLAIRSCSKSLTKAFVEEIEQLGFKLNNGCDKDRLHIEIIASKKSFITLHHDLYLDNTYVQMSLPKDWDAALEHLKEVMKPKEDIRKMPFGKHDVQVNLTKKTVTIDNEHVISTADIKKLVKFRATQLEVQGYVMQIEGTVKFGCKSGTTKEFADIIHLFE